MMNFNNIDLLGMNNQMNMNFMNNNINNIYQNQMNNNMNNMNNINFMNNNLNNMNINNLNLMNMMFQNMLMMQGNYNNINNNNLNSNNFGNNINNNFNIFNNNNINNNIKNMMNPNDNKEMINKKILPKNTLLKGEFYVPDKNKIDIYFESPLQLKVLLSSPPYLTINELFKNFAKKVGLNEKCLNTSLMFIFNGSIIDINDQRSIDCLSFYRPSITVIEIDGINNG